MTWSRWDKPSSFLLSWRNGYKFRDCFSQGPIFRKEKNHMYQSRIWASWGVPKAWHFFALTSKWKQKSEHEWFFLSRSLLCDSNHHTPFRSCCSLLQFLSGLSDTVSSPDLGSCLFSPVEMYQMSSTLWFSVQPWSLSWTASRHLTLVQLPPHLDSFKCHLADTGFICSLLGLGNDNLGLDKLFSVWF